MDLDLSNLSWEQKALIGVGVIVLIILIYAYAPWNSSETIIDNTTTAVVDDVPAQSNNPSYAPVNQESQNTDEQSVNPDTSSSTDNNTNTTSTNQEKTNQINTLQAKEIAAQDGLTAGSPRSGTFKQGNENIPVWIVPLSENNIVIREVYIDKSTGEILTSQELNTASQNSRNNNTGY